MIATIPARRPVLKLLAGWAVVIVLGCFWCWVMVQQDCSGADDGQPPLECR